MITIRHAALEEKYKTYEWLCLSNTAHLHMGAPDYPESPVPDLTQFEEDFEDFYYLESGRKQGSVMIIEKDKEETGCLCYACFHLKEYRAELDIWMKDLRYCGQGLGPQALIQLVNYLKEEFGTKEFIIRPSEKNVNAIRAYEKAGFIRCTDKLKTIEEFLLPEYMDLYGAGDYGLDQTAVLTLRVK